ncbi:hypothetical protein AMECASPLE_035122 [Ameca splendens]|uniref:Uncharacterized protein n=1 Tax=Ameca splendens TaxID=208324 RepID=A0ABV0ZG28_9TELE
MEHRSRLLLCLVLPSNQVYENKPKKSPTGNPPVLGVATDSDAARASGTVRNWCREGPVLPINNHLEECKKGDFQLLAPSSCDLLVLASSFTLPPAKVKTSNLQESFWINFQWTAQALRLLRSQASEPCSPSTS